MSISSLVKQKKCLRCSIVFNCSITESEGNCWCNNFPPLFQPDHKTDCLCPGCLKIATKNKITEYVASLLPEEAMNNKAKDLPKTEKLIEDIDFYIENGNYVFTSWYHLKRGSCCRNGCRHCPYGLKK
ncbi:MAG TPA: DUF5522 domain-containing protein [Bacteroidia bacterium]|jgi:hypothetical protein|nr:DUF5522 domain-containing protein [Bacteroidia bacterium]